MIAGHGLVPFMVSNFNFYVWATVFMTMPIVILLFNSSNKDIIIIIISVTNDEHFLQLQVRGETILIMLKRFCCEISSCLKESISKFCI